MTASHYLVALGSNQRHRQFGRPRDVLHSALGMIALTRCDIEAVSSFITSRPVGPSQRDYVNGAAIVTSALTPHAMLAMLQGVEMLHDRQRRGARWRARTLDLDIILWSEGCISDAQLTIPHPHFRSRDFVLGPAAQIAPDWRDPVTGLSVRQLYARLTKKRIVHR